MKKQIRKILGKAKAHESVNADKQEMFAIFHQPEKEFELKEVLFDELEEMPVDETDIPDLRNLYSKIWSKIEQENQTSKNLRITWQGVLKVAAVLIIGIVTGILVMFESKKTENQFYVAAAPKGSVAEVILPDSTVIFLNTGSQIRYNMDGADNQREVFLTGEAWFDVAKNPEKPFVVHTAFYDVNVTGTIFNVKAYESDNMIATTLEEGVVSIHATGGFKLAEDVVLKPGEQATLNKNSKEFTIKKVNTKWYTSWKDNKLIFINTSLKELVVLLERRYGVEIEVVNSNILDLHFDGTIKNESIIEILNIMKTTLPIDYKITGQQIEIIGKKQTKN